MHAHPDPIPWLDSTACFPPPEQAWGMDSAAPGLLAAGGTLSVDNLRNAYAQGIFPWFSEGQPILWWSTDPRMVLRTDGFILHRSLRKRLARMLREGVLEIRMDSAFSQVVQRCAAGRRPKQNGTWIVPEMINAYNELHQTGLAHSVETWVQGELVAGLYCVALGRAVFGESMFTQASDGSKLALAALVAFCRAQDIPQVDCQQVTSHLASLGAHAVARSDFLRSMREQQQRPPVEWRFDPVYWNELDPYRSP